MFFLRWAFFLLVVVSGLVCSGSVSFAGEPGEIQPVAFFETPSPLVTPQQNAAGATELDQLVDEAIQVTSRRYLTGEVHTPWQIMHALLALRSDLQIKWNGEKVNALQWLGEGRTFKGMPLIEKTQWGGRFHPYVEPYAFEGHPNQFLAMLSMCDLPTSHTLKTPAGESVSIEQMLRNAQMTVNDREEITWTLWSLVRYMPIDSQWHNDRGEAWSIERLVQIETYAEVTHGACGGTHGLFALALARNAYQAKGKPVRGIWMEADQKIRRYIQTARSLQNPDGSFSTLTFAGPKFSTEFAQRIPSQGHTLEFLMVAMTDRELQEDWLQKGVRTLATDLLDNRKSPADCGPLYHSLHALILYRQRTRPTETPEQPKTETLVKAAEKKPVEKSAAEPQKVASNTDKVDAKTELKVDAKSEKTESEKGKVEKVVEAPKTLLTRPDAGSAAPITDRKESSVTVATPVAPATDDRTPMPLRTADNSAADGRGKSAEDDVPLPPTDD